MDRLLRPERFDTEPSAPNAEKLYKHWKMTFMNYLETTTSRTTPTTTADHSTVSSGTATTAPGTNVDRKKLFALFNTISADIFELISDTDDFQSAITILDNAYIKPTSVVYNRHKLTTCTQEPAQSIDSFMQELQRISKSCDFKAVSAEENKQQYVRDAFINGITAPHVRQRLLENTTLSLDDAFKQARALEQAQKQSASYEINKVVAAVPEVKDESQPVAAISKQNNYKSKVDDQKEICFFCGNPRHPCSKCPARNSQCHNCKKPGHWGKMCKSEQVSAGIPGGFNDGPTLA